MENCHDLILQNIVRMDLFLSSQCTLPVPFSVPADGMALADCTFGDAAASFSFSDAAVELLEMPTLKVSAERQQSGVVYTHDLQIPIIIAQEKAKNIVSTLKGKDFNAVYIFADGTKALSYTMPNASICDIDIQRSSSTNTTTFKVKILSMSTPISLS